MSDADAVHQGQTAVVPIFPLNQVLMPGRPLPLRIFEPRYQAMVSDMGETKQFGVVLLQGGLEVITDWAAQPDTSAAGAMAGIGTIAEVMELRPKRDGGYALLAVGSRRFAVRSWVSGKPYAQAEISYLDELDGDITAGLAEEVVS